MSAIAMKHEEVEASIACAEASGEITAQEAGERREANLSEFHSALREAHRPCHVTNTVEGKVWELAHGDSSRSFDSMEGIYEIAMSGKDYRFTEGA